MPSFNLGQGATPGFPGTPGAFGFGDRSVDKLVKQVALRANLDQFLVTNIMFELAETSDFPPPDGRIPEPMTLALLGAGLLGTGILVNRRRRLNA
ncbi:MAG: PEP-CTERM sorting domain-containing protein [Alphaproteobacteria bacterium]